MLPSEGMQCEKSGESPGEIFLRVFREFRPQAALSSIDLQFRPLASASARIEFQDGRLKVRISDLFAPAPPSVQEALAHVLVAKLSRRKPAARHVAAYRRYLNSHEVVKAAEQMRRTRGYKRVRPPAGLVYDLTAIFEELNFRFFHGLMARPALGWSSAASRTILGHYDPAHHMIVISRLLDRLVVPKLAVEYVMYHEMLHLQHPTQYRGARRCVHGEEFRRAEALFPALAEAKGILQEICRQAALAQRLGARRGSRNLV